MSVTDPVSAKLLVVLSRIKDDTNIGFHPLCGEHGNLQ